MDAFGSPRRKVPPESGYLICVLWRELPERSTVRRGGFLLSARDW